MGDVHVQFAAARIPSKNTMELRVNVVDQAGTVVPGMVRITKPQDPSAPMAFTDELHPFGREVMCAVIAALGGPLKSALALSVGEQIHSKAEAVVTEDPPPAPGFSATRVLWIHDPEEKGIVVTFKSG